MSSLIPEQRPDKNGRINTKWVRPQGSSVGSAVSIPAPAMAVPAFSPEKAKAEIKDILASTVAEFDDDHTGFYAKASDQTIKYIHEALTDKSMPNVLKSQLSCMMDYNVEDTVIDAYTATYDFHQNGVENMGAFDDMGEVDFLRGALESGTAPLGFDRDDEDRVRQVKDLFKFLGTTDVEKYSKVVDKKGVRTQEMPARSYQIRNSAIADFIVDHPEKLQDVIDAANEDETDGFENISYKGLADRFGTAQKVIESTSDKSLAISRELRLMALKWKDDHTKFFENVDDETIDSVYEAVNREPQPQHLKMEVSQLMGSKKPNNNVIKAFVTLYDEHKKFPYDELGEVDVLRGALVSGSNADGKFDPNSPEDRRDTMNLFRFVAEADGLENFSSYHRSSVIVEEPMADYIRENPDKIDYLIEVVQNRPELLKGRDKDGIKVVMNDNEGSKSLISGAL